VLSASTLGCPESDLPQVLDWLDQTGVAGLELRLSTGQLADPAMTRGQRAALRQRILDAGHVVTGLASYVRVGADTPDEVVIGALVSAIDIAADLEAPAVRVFPGGPTLPSAYDRIPELQESRAEVDARMVRRLRAVSGYAADRGVRLCLETHDSHPTGELVAGVLGQVEDQVGVVWDVMHPWRVGESLTQTWAALGPWLDLPGSSVQVKDANLPDSAVPLPLGTGTLPLEEFAGLLIQHDYRGPITLEWERAWHPEAAPLDVALHSFRSWGVRHWGESVGVDHR
jgi:sugar phosphate isomerase/epimerase